MTTKILGETKDQAERALRLRIWTLNAYQAEAMRTNGIKADSISAFRLPLVEGGTISPQLLNAALGLAGESGELVDSVKKAIFHGRDLDRSHAIKELGDVLWYVAQAADALGVDLEEVAIVNLVKLRLRYPVSEGFTHEGSRLRRDEAERSYESH